jgi:hypothetical protein
MRSILSLFLFTFCLSPIASWAQDEDYFDDNLLRYEDRTYQENIRTVQFNVQNVSLSLPVIALNGGEVLELSFDDLSGEYQDYSYTVIHCDRNWKPTDIPSSEYITGFLEENVMNYDFSFNTVQKFIHYKLAFPNQNFRMNISGNYVLVVYRDFDRNKPIITRRFRVYEKLVDVKAEVRMPMEIIKRRTHHQVNVQVLHPDYRIQNPVGDLSIQIQQNYRWDNMKTDMKPIFINEGKVTYDNMGDVVFEGGNEYRWLDMRSLRYHPENVRSIWYDPDSLKNHIFMLPDKPFNKDHYVSVPDMNGAFAIEVREGNDPDRDSDYALVHFQFKYDTPVMDGGIYLFGGLTEWQIQPRYRMEYSYRDGLYECTAYLKQGYYNYQYLYVRDGETEGEVELSEASFYAARQIYTFYVYHAQMGQRYDRLIGHTIISSMN